RIIYLFIWVANFVFILKASFSKISAYLIMVSEKGKLLLTVGVRLYFWWMDKIIFLFVQWFKQHG
ncbi:MAG: hypothetical protein QMA99_08940, partial [Flavobacterium sp.]